MKRRDFQTDFLHPALVGIPKHRLHQVATALDAAIAFGALEYASGNASLQNLETLDNEYIIKCARLRSLVGG